MELGLFLTFLAGLIGAMLRVATPLVFASIGEVYTERSGVLNLGIEGIMFLGAFVGFAVAFKAEEGVDTYCTDCLYDWCLKRNKVVLKHNR